MALDTLADYSIEQIDAIHADWRTSHERLEQAIQLERTGDVAGAIATLDAIVGDGPDYGPARVHYARMLADTGDPAGGARHIAPAIKLGMRHPVVMQFAEAVYGILSRDDTLKATALRARLDDAMARRRCTVALAMIVKDEEEHLPRCLESVADVVDETIVVDTGSTDGTIAIATNHGAEVLNFPWRDDFSAARNESLRHVTSDWVLWLDADEELDPDSVGALRHLLANEEVTAANLCVRNLMADRDVPFLTTRLWRNDPTIRFRQPIHEQVYWAIAPHARRFDRRVAEAPEVVILHHGYHPRVAASRDKSARNMRLLEHLVEREPDNAYALFHYAGGLREQGKRDQALQAFEKWESVAWEQSDAQTHWVLVGFANYAGTLNELGEHGRALALVARVTRRLGPTASLRYQTALALQRLGKSREALAELQAAEEAPRTVSSSVETIDFQPMLVPLLTAEVHVSLGETDRARALFDRARELAPDDPRPLCGLARLRIAEGELDDAAADLERAAELAPDEPQTLLTFAQLELFRQNFERAVELTERASELDTGPESLRILGDIHAVMGEWPKAVQAWSRCSDQDSVAAQIALAELLNGRAESAIELTAPPAQQAVMALAGKILAVSKRGRPPGTAQLVELARQAATNSHLRPLRTPLMRLFIKHQFRAGVQQLRSSSDFRA